MDHKIIQYFNTETRDGAPYLLHSGVTREGAENVAATIQIHRHT